RAGAARFSCRSTRSVMPLEFAIGSCSSVAVTFVVKEHSKRCPLSPHYEQVPNQRISRRCFLPSLRGSFYRRAQRPDRFSTPLPGLFTTGRSPHSVWWLLKKEWRELVSSRAWWCLLIAMGPLVGVSFISAANT